MNAIEKVNSIDQYDEVLYFMIRMEYYYLRHSMTIEEMEHALKLIYDKNINLEDYAYLISKGKLFDLLIELEKKVGNIEFVKELRGEY